MRVCTIARDQSQNIVHNLLIDCLIQYLTSFLNNERRVDKFQKIFTEFY